MECRKSNGIELLQKKAIRLITNSSYTAHTNGDTTPLSIELSLLRTLIMAEGGGGWREVAGGVWGWPKVAEDGGRWPKVAKGGGG